MFGAEAFQKVMRGTDSTSHPTHEQNDMIERWFRTLNVECLWRYNFQTLDEARHIIDAFVLTYKADRSHQGSWDADHRLNGESDMPRNGLQTREH